MNIRGVEFKTMNCFETKKLWTAVLDIGFMAQN